MFKMFQGYIRIRTDVSAIFYHLVWDFLIITSFEIPVNNIKNIDNRV